MRVEWYGELPVNMVWRIGGKTVEMLNCLGVTSIEDFVRLEPWQVRDILTVSSARVQAELRGQARQSPRYTMHPGEMSGQKHFEP